MTMQYVWQNISYNHPAPRAISWATVLYYTITLQHWTVPIGGSINMYCITKATFTVVQKQSQQCNTRHLSAEAFTILE